MILYRMITHSVHFTVYALEGCRFSADALTFLKDTQRTHENPFTFNVVNVTQAEKNTYKKQNKMETFPQIFAMIAWQEKSMRHGLFLLGGFAELQDVFK